MYSLAADLRDGRDAVSMTHAPIFFAVAEQRPGAFEPTYEWQEVAQGQSVPSGLDVRRHAMPPAPVPPAAPLPPSRHATVLRCCGAGAPVARWHAQDPRPHPAHMAAAGAVQLRVGGRAGGWEPGVALPARSR